MPSMNIKNDDSDVCCGSSDYDRSPTIWLSDEQCEALGITSPPAPGHVYMLKVRAVATSVTAELESGAEASEGAAPDVRLTLQLTDIDIMPSGPSAATVLYGG